MMHAPDAPLWRPLYSSTDPQQTRAVATSIASMWFDVRLTDTQGRPIQIDASPPAASQYIIQVRNADFSVLVDVLDEIIDEQTTFDTMLDTRANHLGRSHRRLLLGLVIIVSALAAAGVIEI